MVLLPITPIRLYPINYPIAKEILLRIFDV